MSKSKPTTATRKPSRAKFKKTTQGSSVNSKGNKYKGQGR
jgi:hypothetical protein